jgi:predicted transposase YbfD/YdcC
MAGSKSAAMLSATRSTGWRRNRTGLASKPSAGWNSIRIIGDQTSTECRYFLCSFPERDRVAAAVRGHWGIENQQHWVLDVQFGEDAGRTRNDHSAENLALIRRVALNMLRHNGPPRDSIRRRKLRAALNDGYRSRLLLGQSSPATT